MSDPPCLGPETNRLYSPATQSGIYHFHNDICRFFDLRDRAIFYGYDVGPLEDDGFHRVFGHCFSGPYSTFSCFLGEEMYRYIKCTLDRLL